MVKSQSKSWIRLGALLSVALWLAGHGICVADCCGAKLGFRPGGTETKTPAGSCHGGASAVPGQEGSELCCCSVDLIEADPVSVAVGRDADELRFATGAFLFVSSTFTGREAVMIFRQEEVGERPFTPEMRLGPAHRAHAPPSLFQ